MVAIKFRILPRKNLSGGQVFPPPSLSCPPTNFISAATFPDRRKTYIYYSNKQSIAG